MCRLDAQVGMSLDGGVWQVSLRFYEGRLFTGEQSMEREYVKEEWPTCGTKLEQVGQRDNRVECNESMNMTRT